MNTDQYGVPLVIFGPHSEDFFPLLGRAVALWSIIENNVRMLTHRLPISQELKTKPISAILKHAKNGVSKLEQDSFRHTLLAYLNSVCEAAEKRNAYAHSLWPAVSMGYPEVRGWKPEPWKETVELGSDLEELRNDVKTFADLVMSWNDEIIHIYNRLPVIERVEA